MEKGNLIRVDGVNMYEKHLPLFVQNSTFIPLFFRVLDVTQKEKTKQRPIALNTVEMLRTASSGLGESYVRNHLVCSCTLSVISKSSSVFEQYLRDGPANFYQNFTVNLESSWLSNDIKFDIVTIFMMKLLHNLERHLFDL